MRKTAKYIAAALLVGLCVTLSACQGGDTSQVQRTIGESQTYTQPEIEKAMDAVESYFRKNFDGCSLLELTYDSKWDPQAAEWAETADADKAIVLTSSFYVDPDGGDGSLEQDYTYRNWKWIMVKNAFGQWEHWDHGYG